MTPKVKKPGQLPMAAQMAAAVVAVLLVVAAGYFLLVSPKKQSVRDASAEITRLQGELEQGTSQARTAQAQSKIRVADAFRLTKAMPDVPAVGDIVLELSSLADKAGITFDSIQPQDALSQNGFQVQPIRVVFQGSFWELSDFLYRLRSLVLVRSQELYATGRLFTVDQITFTEGQPSFPRISAQLTIDAYIYGGTTTTTGGTDTTTTGTSTTSTVPSSSQ